MCNYSYSQTDYKKVINEKISNAKKKFNDDSLKINGALKIYTGYRIFSQNNSKPFEYRINANLNVSYRGITIPLSYNFSNGRSLYRLSGPNVNIPKFNNLGFSPTYKWAKLHIGTRNMSFSKYTYDNLRFVGGGTELTPGKFQLKFFSGKIFQSSLSDIQLANNFTSPYKRKSWGLMTGYKSETAEYAIIVFRAKDDILSVSDTTLYTKIKPRANTAVGLKLQQTILEKFDIQFERSVSAVTYDLFSKAISIPTHMTVYNMLGLYEKTESSKYAYATRFSFSYSTEQGSYGLNYEHITKDYRSLGSLIFDNNYQSYTLTGSHTFFEKLNVNSEIGIREDGVDKESPLTSNRFVGNISAGYTLNDRVSFNANYSNFRNVERNYFQTLNSLAFDSVSISLLNQNFNISSNIALDKDKKSLITLMYSNQISNRIQSDSLITNSTLNNNIYTINYSYNKEKINISSAISYMQNNAEAFKTKAIIPNFALTYKISDKLNFKSNTTYSLMQTSFSDIQTLSLVQDLNYQITKKQQLIFTNRLNFSSAQTKFKMLENMVEMDYSLKF